MHNTHTSNIHTKHLTLMKHTTHIFCKHILMKKRSMHNTHQTHVHTTSHTPSQTLLHTHCHTHTKHTHTQTECWRRSKGWPGTVATGWSWCWEVFTMLPSNSWDLMRLQQHHTAASVSTGKPSTASGKSSRGYQINHNHPHMVSKKTRKHKLRRLTVHRW